jgi:hypothetical protein
MKLSVFVALLTVEASLAFSGPFVPKLNTVSTYKSKSSLQMVDGKWTEENL